ncbi:4Fe-4S dicluster domain-containing protein [Nitrosophilus kaiyonis]|uniref:4Fe-4S dicluster domain-containing protein n=1 Tax=Nitrosophilus kaiyonis TaxID=2930200 RepID=UPI0024937562|nr:4Fe-4S dicluster domain-containing protein [Nitrosophilus kaiyonis]
MNIYKQNTDIFEFDRLKCLRTDYYHNNCSECIDICPENAFIFDRGKLKLDEKSCKNCGVCVGVCPSEALSVNFFDPNGYIVSLNDSEVFLSCKKDTPCLSIFSTQNFITLALRKDKVSCDLSHCENCELNKENKIYESIKNRIDEANRFLKESKCDKKIEIKKISQDLGRRALFKKMFNNVKELSGEGIDIKSLSNVRNRIPIKNILLKNSIKKEIESINNSRISTNYSFLSNKKIDFDLCNNCSDCVKFCPTDALFYSNDSTTIWFQAGKCISCGICNNICEPKAIDNEENIDLIEYAFDRGKKLVEHKLEICSECKTPFAYKGGELICDRCKNFVNDFGDIFQLASDME